MAITVNFDDYKGLSLPNAYLKIEGGYLDIGIYASPEARANGKRLDGLKVSGAVNEDLYNLLKTYFAGLGVAVADYLEQPVPPEEVAQPTPEEEANAGD